MGSAVSSSCCSSCTCSPCCNSSSDDRNNHHQQQDVVSEDPALQSMLEHFQLADQAVELNNYPKAIDIITKAEKYLTQLSQKHLSEAHLHAMAIFQRRGTYRRMCNQLKEAIAEYEFGLEIGEAKVQKRGTSSQYLVLHLICEISCLMASCHMGLLVACKRIILMRELKENQERERQRELEYNPDLQHESALNNVPQVGPSASSNHQSKNGARPSPTPSEQQQQQQNNNNNNQSTKNYSRPPSQLALLHGSGDGGSTIYNNNVSAAVSFGGKMTPPGEESVRGIRGERNSKNDNNNQQQQAATTKDGFLGVPGMMGVGRSTLQNQKEVLSFRVEDDDMLGAGATSFSFAQSMAANVDLMQGNNSGNESFVGLHNNNRHGKNAAENFEVLASQDPIMGPLMSLPTPALEIQEDLHSKAAERALLHCIELVEELQNRQSELLLGPLFRLADLYETLEMLTPCERCVRRLVGISLVKYGHDHDIYLRQHHRLLNLANQKEERKTLKAAVMISKTWKMKTQMKKLKAANARQFFEPRRHTKAVRDGAPLDEAGAADVLSKVMELGEDPPSEYEESEDDEPNFDDDYENYDENDLIVPGWDEKSGNAPKGGAATAADLKRMAAGKKDGDKEDAFKGLRD